METLTLQQVFDKVARHLLTQGAKAMGGASGEQCQYRAANGLKCAAGALIPDDCYDPRIEGFGSETDAVIPALRAGGVPEEADGLVAQLQSIHDQIGVQFWPCSLRACADGYGLSDAVIDELRPAVVGVPA